MTETAQKIPVDMEQAVLMGIKADLSCNIGKAGDYLTQAVEYLALVTKHLDNPDIVAAPAQPTTEIRRVISILDNRFPEVSKVFRKSRAANRALVFRGYEIPEEYIFRIAEELNCDEGEARDRIERVLGHIVRKADGEFPQLTREVAETWMLYVELFPGAYTSMCMTCFHSYAVPPKELPK